MGINVYPPASSSAQPYEQIFTRSGTWTKPSGVKTCEVTVVGGGGGSSSSSGAGTSNGGAGGYVKRIVDVSATSSVAITIGAGGSYSNSAPTVGGQSSFGSNIIAYGGNTGNINTSSNITFCQNGNGTASSGVSEVIGEDFNSIVNFKSRTVGSWSNATTGNHSSYCYTKNNGVYLATVVDAGGVGRSTATSTDGITWTTNATVVPAQYNVTGKIPSVAGRFILTPNASSSSIYSSTDGVTWTTGTLPSAQNWWGAADNGTVALVQGLGLTTAAYSTNGTSWTSTTLPNSGYIGGAGSYLYSPNGSGAMSYSTNGTSWTACTGTVPTSGRNIHYLPTLNRYFAWSDSPGMTTNYMSANGIAWTSATGIPSTNRSGQSVNVVNRIYIIGEVIFAHAYLNTDTAIAAIFMSVDGGQSWTESTGPQFIRNPGTTSGSWSQQGATYNIKALPVDNSRHVLGWSVTNTAGSVLYNPIIMFSNALTGGYTGASSAGGVSSMSSAGSFSSNAQIISASDTTLYYGSTSGGGSPEGFARGYGYLYNQSGVIGYATLNYGDGAASGSAFGGQGIVIVRWYA